MMNYSTYEKTMADRINSAKPETLMVMLVDGMVTRIKQAKERIEANQHQRARNSIVRSMKIADALMEHLNFEQGGETAEGLEKLYYYVISELAMANNGKENPSSHLDNALKVLEILLEGFKKLEQKTA